MKAKLWIGRVLTALTGTFVLTSGLNVLFLRSDAMVQGFTQFGYPENAMTPIGIAASVSGLLYLVPRASFFGAILMTAYLGGATATHVRINDPTLVAPVVTGILTWAGLFLRDAHLRSLVMGGSRERN